jgi:Xaa-Pro dipeptidase
MNSPSFNRRAALGAFAGTAAGATLGGAAAPAHAKPVVPVPEIDGRLLVNRDRATEILTRFGLQGMIALNPINVTYLTNIRTIGMKFITEYPGFATYAADPQAPIYLVTGGTTAAWDIANGTRETADIMPYGFGGWNAADVNSDGLPVEPEQGGRTRRYHVRDDVELTEREKAWAAVQDKYADGLAAGASWALARALKAQGITSGKVAVDDMRIAGFLAQTDLRDSVECVPGYGVFQYIRMVKTPQELAYQRVGGRSNGDACLATIRQIEAGMTHDDIENIFLFECAQRGNRMDSFLAGMPGGGFPDGVMVKGKPFLMDCVSSFKGYMGDTARTFIIGEPDAETKKRRKANQTAREVVFDAIKPGVKYSELRRIGFDTMVKNGMPEHAVFVTPHSVGLQHDDNPSRLPQFGIDGFDHVLEENMVLTVDLPYLEVGWGSGHNEDLFRVTATGYEPLNTEKDPFIIL